MTLNTSPDYPAIGGYVLKLHRDTHPRIGHLVGRIEHVASGARTEFTSGEDLLAWLIKHASDLHSTQT